MQGCGAPDACLGCGRRVSGRRTGCDDRNGYGRAAQGRPRGPRHALRRPRRKHAGRQADQLQPGRAVGRRAGQHSCLRAVAQRQRVRCCGGPCTHRACYATGVWGPALTRVTAAHKRCKFCLPTCCASSTVSLVVDARCEQHPQALGCTVAQPHQVHNARPLRCRRLARAPRCRSRCAPPRHRPRPWAASPGWGAAQPPRQAAACMPAPRSLQH